MATAKAPVLPPVEELSDEQAQAYHALLSAELQRREQRMREEFLAETKAKAERLGLDGDTLAALLTKGPRRKRSPKGGDGRSKVNPKYRNPKLPHQTWSGRGKTPKWVETDAHGTPLSKYLIAETTTAAK